MRPSICLLSILFMMSFSTASNPSSASTGVTNGKIAFASDRDGDMEIYTIDADGSNLQQLTFNSGLDMEPNWSPDGTRIIFRSDRDNNDIDLFIMNADGSNQRNIPNQGTSDWEPDWSPTGDRIAFGSIRNGKADLFIMNVDGTNVVNVTHSESGTFRQPTWSPDGQQIAFLSDEGRPSVPAGTEFYDLYTINADGTNRRVLPANAALGNLDWSPDGNLIIYFNNDRLRDQIMGISPNGGQYQRIVNNPNSMSNPSWSPDGQRFVFETTDGNIGVINLDGSGFLNLTNTQNSSTYVRNSDPHWQPVMVVSPTPSSPAATPSPCSSCG